MKARVCITIVTFNSSLYLKDLCDSLKTYVDISKDCIAFIDNCSTDETVSYLKEAFAGVPNVFIFENGLNKGFGHANNEVMRKVYADFYLLLNHDTYLSNDLISDLFSFYPDKSNIDILGPFLVFPDGSYQTSAYSFSSPLKWFLQDLQLKKIALLLSRLSIGKFILKRFTYVPMVKPFVEGLFANRPNESDKNRECVDWITGACMLISRKVFEATAGFDENIFMYGEDEELCFRAKKNGFNVERVNAGPVVHYLGRENNKKYTISPLIYESIKYVIDKNNEGYPFKRWLLKKILYLRFLRYS